LQAAIDAGVDMVVRMAARPRSACMASTGHHGS
jgi:hypothetical protein